MRALVWLLVAAALWTGCGGEPAASARNDAARPGAAPPAAGAGTPPTALARDASGEPIYHLPHAQPKLQTVRVLAGSEMLTSEVCLTLEQVATGLMFRESLGEDEGMLFVFRTPQQRAFYMKNVKFPIAAAYIDDEGVIQEIVQLKPMDETPILSKSDRIQFVLETAPDWFQKRNLGPGTLVMCDLGPLREALAASARLN